jgi:hypothetical protein
VALSDEIVHHLNGRNFLTWPQVEQFNSHPQAAQPLLPARVPDPLTDAAYTNATKDLPPKVFAVAVKTPFSGHYSGLRLCGVRRRKVVTMERTISLYSVHVQATITPAEF